MFTVTRPAGGDDSAKKGTFVKRLSGGNDSAKEGTFVKRSTAPEGTFVKRSSGGDDSAKQGTFVVRRSVGGDDSAKKGTFVKRSTGNDDAAKEGTFVVRRSVGGGDSAKKGTFVKRSTGSGSSAKEGTFVKRPTGNDDAAKEGGFVVRRSSGGNDSGGGDSTERGDETCFPCDDALADDGNRGDRYYQARIMALSDKCWDYYDDKKRVIVGSASRSVVKETIVSTVPHGTTLFRSHCCTVNEHISCNKHCFLSVLWSPRSVLLPTLQDGHVPLFLGRC